MWSELEEWSDWQGPQAREQEGWEKEVAGHVTSEKVKAEQEADRGFLTKRSSNAGVFPKDIWLLLVNIIRSDFTKEEEEEAYGQYEKTLINLSSTCHSLRWALRPYLESSRCYFLPNKEPAQSPSVALSCTLPLRVLIYKPDDWEIAQRVAKRGLLFETVVMGSEGCDLQIASSLLREYPSEIHLTHCKSSLLERCERVRCVVVKCEEELTVCSTLKACPEIRCDFNENKLPATLVSLLPLSLKSLDLSSASGYISLDLSHLTHLEQLSVSVNCSVMVPKCLKRLSLLSFESSANFPPDTRLHSITTKTILWLSCVDPEELRELTLVDISTIVDLFGPYSTCSNSRFFDLERVTYRNTCVRCEDSSILGKVCKSISVFNCQLCSEALRRIRQSFKLQILELQSLEGRRCPTCKQDMCVVEHLRASRDADD